MENEVINTLIENTGEEEVTSQLNSMMHDSYSEHFISDFINTFEETKRKKSTTKKKVTGVVKFMENDDADANPIASAN
jgi:hypothetical protein